MAPIDVGEADFQQRVVGVSRTAPVVVDFWAGWCRPCLVLGPVLERLVDEHGGRIVLAKVDVDANPGLAARFGIQGIPAVKAFLDGRVVSEFVGAQPEAVVRGFLDQLAPSPADDLAARGAELEAAGRAEAAEAAYREALDAEPDHPAAAAGLGRLLLASGRREEAAGVLRSVAATEEVRPVLAQLELAELAEASDSGVEEAAAAAIAGDHERALERALELLSGDGQREAARQLMVRIFEVLGEDHPLTREYRPRLARALF